MAILLPILTGVVVIASIESVVFLFGDGIRKDIALTSLIVVIIFDFLVKMVPFIIVSAMAWNMIKEKTANDLLRIKVAWMLVPITVYSGGILAFYFLDILLSNQHKSTSAIGLGLLYLFNFPLLIIGSYIGNYYCKISKNG